MSAKVTFGNLNGRASSVPHVTVTAVKEDVGSSPVVTPTSTSPGSDRRIRFRGNSESSADKPPSRPTLCFVEEDDTVRLVLYHQWLAEKWCKDYSNFCCSGNVIGSERQEEEQ